MLKHDTLEIQTGKIYFFIQMSILVEEYLSTL